MSTDMTGCCGGDGCHLEPLMQPKPKPADTQWIDGPKVERP